MENQIDITGVDLSKFVREAYNLSRPQGLGYLHHREGGLPEDELQAILKRDENSKYYAVSMDYVMGRAVKMTVHKSGDRLVINDRWFDHSDEALKTLLDRCGVTQDA